MASATFTALFATAGTFTWVAPAGVSSVSVQAWGGGGGGGGSSGGGGGGGEYAAELANTCVAGDAYTVVVGAAGTAGTTTGTGGTGGNSSFTGTSATTVTAHGGTGGLDGSTHNGAGGAGGTGSSNSAHFNGGTGGSSTDNVSQGGAGGGGSAGTAAAGNNGSANTGSTGGAGASAVTGGGPGGTGGAGTGTSGTPGSAPGSGPGGGGGGGGFGTTNPSAGGAGFAGQVLITWTMATPAVIAANTTGGTYKWTAPAGVTSVDAQAIGAGGAGGGATSTTSTTGGGGGGGEDAEEPSLAVTAGNSYAFTVGTAGAGVAGGTGGSGGNTTMAGDSVTVTAHGGSGGAEGTNGASGAGGTGSSNTTHHNGGAGAAGTTNANGGGGGSSAGTSAAGNNGSGASGGSAVTGGGPGGAGASAAGDGSAPASGPGGGGGGARGGTSTRTGGAGFNGQLTLTWSSNIAGTASLSAAASMTAGATQTLQETAALSATAAVTAAAKLTLQQAATLSVAATLTAVPPVVFTDALPSLDFPANELGNRVELLINGTWTDVTQWTMHAQITGGRGKPDESTTAAPSTLALTLANEDGRFTSKNPSGPYYPYLRRNLPCRVSIPEGASYLRLENDSSSYAQCPDSAGVSITGDMDIQMDVTLDNWNAAQILACKWAETGNERTWLLLANDIGTLTLVVSSDGTGSASTTHSYFSGIPMTLPPLQRMCIRVTYAHATGTVTFYTAPAGNLATASWTQTDQQTDTTVTSLFNSTAPVQTGYGSDVASLTASGGTTGINGKIHAFRLLSGIAGTEKASPDFTQVTAGATSFADTESNTWTVEGTSEISDRDYRAHAEIPTWPQEQDPTGHTVYVPLTGGGKLRRISQRQASVNSPMYRAIVRMPAANNLAAYWSGEDGAQAPLIGQAAGKFPMGNAGLTMSSFTGFNCSAAIPVMNGGTATALVDPSSVTWDDNVFRFLLAVPDTDDTNLAVAAQFTTQGTIAIVQLIYGTGGGLTLNCYNSAGAAVAGASIGPVGFGLTELATCRVSMEVRGNGTTGLWVITPGGGIFGGAGTWSGTVGGVTSVASGGGLVGSAMGHWSVQGTWDTLTDLSNPLNGWYGERAAARVARLAAEEGWKCRIRGRASSSVPMGYQSVETIQQLIQECADADLGMITEPRQVLGIGYRTRGSIGNMDAGVTLDYDQDHLDAYASPPLEDDQIIVNDVTVTQTSAGSSSSGGATARMYAAPGQPIDGGYLNVNEPDAAVPGAGRYDQSYNVNVLGRKLTDNAGMRLHAGTVDEPRYPGIAIDLANATLTPMLPDIAALDLGDRLVIDDPQGWLPPGLANAVDEVISSYTETLHDPRTWKIVWNTVPYSPYPVGIVGADKYGRFGTAGSTVHANTTYGASTFQADTPGTLWTTDSGQYPFLLIIAGMVIKVSACSGASSPQTFTVSQWGVNGVQVNLIAGDPVKLAYPAIYGM